ncbi:MAG: Maf family protein [Candidatus Goldbacteria bacterium]|nr:Maf family protein [Candidatus Goldiibacteriota bacterium]
MYKRLILASTSPRRKQILTKFGFEFEVQEPKIDENRIFVKLKNIKPYKIATSLAYEKARSVLRKFKKGIVIGADTIVVLGREVIGKPKSKKHAIEILKKLSNSTHTVITAIALIDIETGKSLVTYDASFVTFKKLTIKQINDYVNNNHILDKAGAYAVQEGADPFIKKIKGSYYNVVGFPIEKFKRILREWNDI